MLLSRLPGLLTVFRAFYRYAPKRVSLNLLLMLFHSLSAGVGLLLIIPLLQLVGFDMQGENSSGITHVISSTFEGFDLQLTLPAVLTIYVLLVGVIASLTFYQSVLTAQIQHGYICHLRDQLFRSLVHTRWQFITQHRLSDFVQSLSGQVQTVGYMGMQLLNLLSQSIMLIIYSTLAFLLSWKLTLLSILCAGGLFLILLPLNRHIFQSGERQLGGNKRIFQMLSEQLACLKMIKSYSSETRYANELHRVGQKMEEQHVRITRINALTRMIYTIGAVAAFSLLFYFATQHLGIPLATLLLLLFIFSRLLPQVSSIHGTLQQLTHQLPHFDDLTQFSADCAAEQEGRYNPADIAPQIKQAIQLRNIRYCYPGKSEPVLESFNATIGYRQSVALVGPSGTGKSTLADIICGLLQPDSGDILIDQTALDDSNRLAWRNTVSYVTQEVYLFHDTVRNNLKWVHPQASEEDIWQALDSAAAKDFVEQLPQGLDTLIGDRGIRLSGGERQRLALARALLTQPQLLILDEATSALDNENERKIQQALQRLHGQLTIIIIAHRQSTIEHVDLTIELGYSRISLDFQPAPNR